MASPIVIRSVGIDIGTTTTQVIFSRLEVVNRASISQVPNYEFSARDITYVGPVSFTPVDQGGHIDEQTVRQFILSQYAAAELTPEEVGSGALIITGETSKAHNARDAVMGLAQELGDFIVATAGPHLESVIAGQGSGAAEVSRQGNARVLNIDIGGGTSNYVVFESGRVVDSACLNVGGHLLELLDNGDVHRIHGPAETVCEALFGSAPAGGRTLNSTQVQQVADKMAALIYEVALGQPSALAKQLLMTECLRQDWRYDAVFISGGVGYCYYLPAAERQQLSFGDLGPMLATALLQHDGFTGLPLRQPRHTLRATVIGAGAYTLSLSGSTVWVDSQQLPLRNLPVIHPSLEWQGASAEQICQAWQEAAKRMDIQAGEEIYALALPEDMPVSYREVDRCVQALALLIQQTPVSRFPVIIVARQDVGKVLGMLLQPLLAQRELAVIDEVATHPGDYLDIGKPFPAGEIVPVTVKSLAFPS